MPVPNSARCLRCGRPLPNQASGDLRAGKAVGEPMCSDCQAMEEERAVEEGMALTAEEEADTEPRES
jgi:hypothetical protein